ncbi:MAG: 16S rRNA (uracil(1498)-N(3))-methyltransferase [Armatimonadetes bacterium]|nr:16S rRNA (uracil(1498)-N(3))-methyltransferase [Armatimonadota bacterium]
MHHFHISPDQMNGDRVELTPEQAHQVARVLRLRPGDVICLLDGSCRECRAVLAEVSPGRVAARAGEWRRCAREPDARLCLALGLLKGEKMDWAVQKATEVGVCEVVPLLCARSIVRLEEGRDAGKVQRWQRIAREAAEQCRRARVPAISPPLSLGSLLERAAEFDLILLADEGESAPLSPALAAGMRKVKGERRTGNAVGLRVLLLVGPEGGFAPEETRRAQEAGAVAVSLGARILRAETAAVVGPALVLHELERTGGTT